MEQDINEDIKILERMLKIEKECLHYDVSQDEIRALEHLIKAYKELEKSNQEKAKMLTEQNRNLQISYDSLQELFELRKYKNSSIPVSLIEETIEEINKLITEAQKELGSASKEYTIYVYQKDILQKLLEKRK